MTDFEFFSWQFWSLRFATWSLSNSLKRYSSKGWDSKDNCSVISTQNFFALKGQFWKRQQLNLFCTNIT